MTLANVIFAFKVNVVNIISSIPKIKNCEKGNFFLIAGPCAIEGRDIAFEIAGALSKLCDELSIPFIFKGSFRKANRSSLNSFTGIGDQEALQILGEIGETFSIPTLTDIHESDEADLAARYVDVLQIPAFLSRQTNLILAASNTGKTVNIKKGQFLSGDVMKFAVEKARSTGNQQVMLTERGNSFGYTDMVVDFRGIPLMQETGVPVILDITHSVQRPNQSSGVTEGNPQMIETLAKAGIAVGVDGLFIETHPNPSSAKSDGSNMLPLDKLKPLLEKLIKIRSAL